MQRSIGQESAGEVQRGRHSRGSKETDSSPNRHQVGENRPQEVVHHLQGN